SSNAGKQTGCAGSIVARASCARFPGGTTVPLSQTDTSGTFVYSRRGLSVRISAQHVARIEHARPLVKVKQERHMIPYRRIVLWTFVTALLLVFIAHGEAQTITLEQLMSSPFPSELIASKRGDKVAWVFYSQGKRNVFVAEAPALAARQLTHHDVEDGQDVTEIVFSPNGNTIAYVRGGNK